MLRNAVELDGKPGGLSDDPQALRTGYNSGYQALNLAVLAGATRLVLLGYDMKAANAAKSHWFGDHPAATEVTTFQAMRPHFEKVAPTLAKRGVEVINCSPDSALRCFKRAPIEVCLLSDPPGPAVSP